MTLSIKALDRICLLVVVAVFFASGYWVASRSVRQLKGMQRENDVLSKSLRDSALMEKNLHLVNAAIAETRNQVKALNERIPDSADIGEFLRRLDTIMKQRGIFLENFQPLPLVKEKLFTRVPIRLISRGSFVDVYNLVHDLEAMNRLVDVENVAITNASDGSECRFDITASIFER